VPPCALGAPTSALDSHDFGRCTGQESAIWSCKAAEVLQTARAARAAGAVRMPRPAPNVRPQRGLAGASACLIFERVFWVSV
jgi:hypothetical protein